nr:hypothetical protein GCM10020092_089640 [Actinoplanes digitatis]
MTEQVLALLALLGPDAVAADPLLPLRVRHEAACLPLLDPRVRTAITEIPRQVKTQIESHAASSRASAGTVGLRRRGTPRSLLRTQLALPSELRNLLEVRGNLLYRLHDGEPELHLEPMVLVLDTSPPTFGPVESTLRLVAHGLAGGLLGRQREAAVVTLDRPARVVPLRRHSDLMALWTSRMLDPPQLRTALLTAESVGFAATAVLTTHHVAREYPLPGRANLRVVTAHAPGEKPPLATTNPYTVHLGPRAQATEIARAVVTILVGADGR